MRRWNVLSNFCDPPSYLGYDESYICCPQQQNRHRFSSGRTSPREIRCVCTQDVRDFCFLRTWIQVGDLPRKPMNVQNWRPMTFQFGTQTRTPAPSRTPPPDREPTFNRWSEVKIVLHISSKTKNETSGLRWINDRQYRLSCVWIVFLQDGNESHLSFSWPQPSSPVEAAASFKKCKNIGRLPSVLIISTAARRNGPHPSKERTYGKIWVMVVVVVSGWVFLT